MQQHYMTKKFNYVLVLVCTAILLVSSYNLFLENTLVSIRSPLTELGRVIELKNTVKHKKSHLFSWNNAGKHSPVHSDDLIYTHKESNISVQIQDKTIKLAQETMIKIQSFKTLTIQEGEVELTFTNKDSSLEIIIAGTKYFIKSDKAKVKINKSSDKASFTVDSGRVKIQEENTDEVFNITKSKKLIITNSQVEVVSRSISLIAPENKIFSTKNKIKKVIFRAKSKNKAKLLISRDRVFENSRQEYNFNQKLELDLGLGEYFWKLITQVDSSETRSFQIVRILPNIDELIPINNYQMNYYQKQTKILFSWTQPKHKSFLIEIFNENNQMILQKEVTNSKYLWDTNYKGIVKWQITSIGKNVIPVKSQINSLSLNRIQLEKNKPFVIELSKPNQKVQFNWQRNKSSNYDLFELSDSPNFKNIIIKKKLKRSSTEITFPKIGIFYWRSNSINKSGEKVWNLPIKVLIRPTPPLKKPKKLPALKLKLQTKIYLPSFLDLLISRAIANTGGFVSLDWPALSDAKLYEIEIYADKKLKNRIKLIKSKISKYKWNAPRAGEFYWRYRYKDYWGRYSTFSEPSKLQLIRLKKSTETKVSTYKKQNIKQEKQIQSINLGFSPSSINYKETTNSNNQFKINGEALNGWELKYKKQLNRVNYITALFLTRTGLVFNGEEFQTRKMDINYNFPLIGSFFSAGLIINSLPTYQNVSSKAKFDKQQTALLITTSAKYIWQKLNILTDFKVGMGQGKFLNISSSYQFYSHNRYSFITSVSYEYFEAQLSNNEIITQQLQFVIGPKFNF